MSGRRRTACAVGALALALSLGACAVGAPEPSAGARGDARVVQPVDGEFISERAAVALRLDADVEREPVEHAVLEAAAGLDHEPVLAYAGVLRADIAGGLPHITVLLEEGTATEDAEHVLERLGSPSGVVDGQAVTVYAHDLVLSAEVADPAATVEGLALEGILSDALGFHEVETSGSEVRVRYVGPLLSQVDLDSAVDAVARAGGVAPEAVEMAAGTPGDPVSWADVEDPFAEVRRLQRSTHGHG